MAPKKPVVAPKPATFNIPAVIAKPTAPKVVSGGYSGIPTTIAKPVVKPVVKPVTQNKRWRRRRRWQKRRRGWRRRPFLSLCQNAR